VTESSVTPNNSTYELPLTGPISGTALPHYLLLLAGPPDTAIVRGDRARTAVLETPSG
jgi:hypothetical protein